MSFNSSFHQYGLPHALLYNARRTSSRRLSSLFSSPISSSFSPRMDFLWQLLRVFMVPTDRISSNVHMCASKIASAF